MVLLNTIHDKLKMGIGVKQKSRLGAGSVVNCKDLKPYFVLVESEGFLTPAFSFL